MNTVVVEPETATTFICPDCGSLATLTPGEGRDIAAVYCLHVEQRTPRERGIAAAHPTRMELLTPEPAETR